MKGILLFKGSYQQLMLHTFKLTLILNFLCLTTFGQNQKELPIFALRNIHSWGPNFEAFNPTIAVYKNGTVIFKILEDSNFEYPYYKYYQTKINVKTIDSIIIAFNIDKGFDTLKQVYSPFEKQTDIKISDASRTFISVHHKTNITVSIYCEWADDDSLFLYNPKPAKLLHDWLLDLRKVIIENKSYTVWTPSTIDIVRGNCEGDEEIKMECKKCNHIKFKNDFYKKDWIKFGNRISKNYKTHLKYEIYTTSNPEEINYFMKKLNKSYLQTTKFKGRLYRIFYTFSYDITPFYFDYLKQFNCM